jgi:UDP-N-acetylmuramyl pentapeptide phosphotransferase/UDP-N-acetylglucosamine-1-phosphate transferase
MVLTIKLIKQFAMINLNWAAPLCLLGSFLLVVILIPKISWIVESLNLIHHPDRRSSHKSLIPTMAGISFFLALIFMSVILKEWDLNKVSLNLIAAVGLMFAIGLKDDLVVSTPRAKIIGEIIAIFLVMFCGSLEVTSLNGLLGIFEISAVASYVFIVLMILIIINSYNLIDGIDGLAASIGIVVLCLLSYFFYILDAYFYFLLALCLIGMLVAYLGFNLSKTKKVFMGDTGSLIIGFCIGFLCLKYLSLDPSLLVNKELNPENSLIIIIAIFFVPLFDTVRVIGVRLINKTGLFSPDTNHIHHILINSGLTHFKASLFLSILNLIIAISLVLLSKHYNSFWMVVITFFYFLFFLVLFYKLKKNIGKVNRSKYLISAIQFLF